MSHTELFVSCCAPLIAEKTANTTLNTARTAASKQLEDNFPGLKFHMEVLSLAMQKKNPEIQVIFHNKVDTSYSQFDQKSELLCLTKTANSSLFCRF